MSEYAVHIATKSEGLIHSQISSRVIAAWLCIWLVLQGYLDQILALAS